MIMHGKKEVVGSSMVKRVLVVDDEVDFVESLTELLESHEYVVESINSIGELKKIKNFSSDVALIDIRLGRESGIDLLQQLKEMSPSTICVMMTAFADVNTAIAALNKGAYDYLRKPFDPLYLLSVLNRCFEKRHLEREKEFVEKALWERNLELLEINNRLKAIVKSTKSLTSCSRLEEMGQLILQEFAQNMVVEGGSLYFIESDSLVLTHSLDPGHAPDKIPLPLKKGSILEKAMRKGEPIFIKDIKGEKGIVKSGWGGYSDGSLLIFPIPDESGKIVGIISLHSKSPPPFVEQDIEIGSVLASYSCEALRAAQATRDLEESERRLELALSGADLGLWNLDLKSGKLEGNKRTYEIVGYTKNEIEDIFNWWDENIHPEDKERAINAMAEHLENHTPFYDVRQRLKTKSGKYIWVHNRGRVVERDDEGNPTKLAGVSRDVTETKLAEMALVESEEKWRNLFENSIDGAFTLDLKGTFTSLNKAFAEALGYDLEELVGKNYRQFVTIEEADNIFTAYNHLFRTGEPIKNFRTKTIRKNGEETIAEANANLIMMGDEIIGFQGTIRNMTERIKSEEEIKYLKEFSENIINHMVDHIDIINERFEVVFQNRRSIEKYGKADGKKCFEMYGRKAQCKQCTAIKAIYDGKTYKRETEMEDGTFLEVYSSPILMPEGEICSIEIVRDITDRKLAEKEIRESKERLSEAQRIAHIGSWDRDFSTNSVYWSDEMYRLFSLTPETFTHSLDEIVELVHPDDREFAADSLIKTIGNRQKKIEYEYRIINPDKTYRHVQSIGKIFYDTEGNPTKIVGTVQDITEMKKIQSQLATDQKMKAVGTLAGGIAHDFNNILAVILGYASFLKTKSVKDDPFYNGLSAIENSSIRAAELTLQLLAYSRKGKLEIRPFNINTVIVNVHDIISKTFEKTVEVVIDTDENLKNIEGDMSQMNQVVMNLAINAKEAMPDGGTLKIRTFMENVVENIEKEDFTIIPGNYVCVEFTDTGIGMDEDTQKKIFEPYFSTRKEKGGTGLGMSVVYGIVRNHEGYITISSTPEKGTDIMIYIPASRAEAEQIKEEVFEEGTGTETILVIDDEKNVLDMLRNVLEGAGYTVFTESSSNAGLKRLKENLHLVDIVILDIIMPDIRCNETLENILNINRDMKVLLASGYSEEDQHHGLIEIGAKGFIGKPFLADKLLGKIREVLR